MVEDRVGRQPLDIRGLSLESLRHHRCLVSDSARRDDERPNLFPEYRRAHADPGIHQEGRDPESPVAASSPDDGPGGAQFSDSVGMADREPTLWSHPTRCYPSNRTQREIDRQRERAGGGRSKGERKRKKKEPGTSSLATAATESGGVSALRLLLFVAFSMLSLQATRNSHQFAAVVGSVTAWNFAEWASAVWRRGILLAGSGQSEKAHSGAGLFGPRVAAAAAIAAVLIWVGSGLFYEMTGEKRTISMGEEPLFFPHKAARFAGRPEMPERFLSFHNGHAAVFEYHHGPERKVYTDPRLEVAGADLFRAYSNLEKAIRDDQQGWQARSTRSGVRSSWWTTSITRQSVRH